MEMEDLKIFCDLVELKSFTHAGEKNGLTQSAVSQRIRNLDDYYGNKIFLDKKRLVLSSHGKYLYEKFKDILRIYLHTQNLIGSESAKQIVSIGLCENAKARYYRRELVYGLLAEQLCPEIYFGPSRNIYEKVLFGSLDYGVVGTRPEDATGLEIHGLFTEELVLATSLKNRQRPFSLMDAPLILDHRDSGLFLFLKTKLRAGGIDIEQLNIKAYAGTTVDKGILLAKSGYFSFVPKWYVDQVEEIEAVNFDMELIREFYEVYQKKRRDKIDPVKLIIRNTNDF